MELISPSSHSVFHAVYVPIEDDTRETEETQFHVYCDKAEALNIIKKHTKGRLKTFKTLEEAQEFARNGLESILPNPLANSVPTIVLSEEKTNNFKSLKPQNLAQFRKVIEYGDIASVKNTIWENPRYLIGNGDTPSILHEGCRYNALHVAIKVTESPDMCELILNTVGDPEFVKLYYGDSDATSTYVDRASILQDLYLNTPDRVLNETPLHFAAKYGLKDCVRTLLTYSQCLRTPLNKYEMTPADIVCTRKSVDDQSLMNEIRLLLEEQYYVPVLRAEDNSLQPTIGEPFSPSSPLQLNVDPISPRVEVRAFAGPMTKSQALEFRKKWKTPPRILGTPNKQGNAFGDYNGLRSPSLNLSLRLKDTDKGLERVGRELASEYQIAWKEYWSFLQDFTDLQCNEGLEKLEKFLRNRFQQRSKTILLDLVKVYMNVFETPKLKHEMNLEDLDNTFQQLTIQSQIDSDEEIEDNTKYITPPSSPLCKNNNDNVESSDEDDMDSADDNIKEEIFLEGKTPTKIDFAVFSAIPSTIDVMKYPFIYRWRHEMQLASKNVNNLFRTPRNFNTKRKLFYNEM